MDPALIERKLESLDRCVQRINEKYPDSADDLAEDYDRQDIIAVNLERGVQSCVDLAAEGMINRAIAGRMDR